MASPQDVSRPHRSIRLNLAAWFIGILSACAVGFEPGSLSGRANFEDGKPAVGAYVVGTWTGATPIAGSHGCYRAIVGQTDAQGRYRLVAQDKMPNVVDVDAEAFAFMPGHMAAKENEDANGLLIGPPATDKKAYFKYVMTVASKLFCGRSNWQTSTMVPLAHVLIDEMSQSATSPDDRTISRRLAESLTGDEGR